MIRRGHFIKPKEKAPANPNIHHPDAIESVAGARRMMKHAHKLPPEDREEMMHKIGEKHPQILATRRRL